MSAEMFRREIPVHMVPERLYVLRPQVAEVDVVGVFPDVDRQYRGLALRKRAAGVAGIDDFDRAVLVLYQPGPARAEIADGTRGELFLEGGERTEGLVDSGCQCA